MHIKNIFNIIILMFISLSVFGKEIKMQINFQIGYYDIKNNCDLVDPNYILGFEVYLYGELNKDDFPLSIGKPNEKSKEKYLIWFDLIDKNGKNIIDEKINEIFKNIKFDLKLYNDECGFFIYELNDDFKKKLNLGEYLAKAELYVKKDDEKYSKTVEEYKFKIIKISDIQHQLNYFHYAGMTYLNLGINTNKGVELIEEEINKGINNLHWTEFYRLIHYYYERKNYKKVIDIFDKLFNKDNKKTKYKKNSKVYNLIKDSIENCYPNDKEKLINKYFLSK